MPGLSVSESIASRATLGARTQSYRIIRSGAAIFAQVQSSVPAANRAVQKHRYPPGARFMLAGDRIVRMHG
ncbi:MAG: hypothetical protein A3J49_13400 [Gallionellales bacterium RIFCSPHIGHO2_02_FULL_57_16]|nr:MAG: hypothetical protein A3J49_13400 [Gallionellales bacterium RIFCSPHIGHO2_02_FULL_57_16]